MWEDSSEGVQFPFSPGSFPPRLLIARYQVGPDPPVSEDYVVGREDEGRAPMMDQRSQYLALSPQVWAQNLEWAADPQP